MLFDYPQETVDPYMVVDESSDSELLQKLSSEALTDEQLDQAITLVWELDEHHPTFWTGLCKKLLITLSRDRLQGKL